MTPRTMVTVSSTSATIPLARVMYHKVVELTRSLPRAIRPM